LKQATTGLWNLLASMRDGLALSAIGPDEQNYSTVNADIAHALAAPEPAAFAAARARMDEHAGGGDGDDGRTVVLFLRAHLKLLEQAVDDNAAIVYGLYI
jgi:hypothetical protein